MKTFEHFDAASVEEALSLLKKYGGKARVMAGGTDLLGVLKDEILEDYPDDPRGPSCLVLGYVGERPLHIVCGYTPATWIRIITVYIPKPPKWTDERTRRRGGEFNA